MSFQLSLHKEYSDAVDGAIDTCNADAGANGVT